jgi:hypothetical protein
MGLDPLNSGKKLLTGVELSLVSGSSPGILISFRG